MMAFPLVGCRKEQETFALDRVIVLIKADYQQEFENKEFNVEDFMFDNARAAIYLDWYSNSNIVEPYGSITIYLNNSGEQKVLDAIKHFKTLDFVKDAIKIDKKFALDRISIKVKSEYQQEFENKEFTVEDFSWDNVRMIIYQDWKHFATVPYGTIELYLIESGMEQILGAIEYFESLEFIENARELEENFVYDTVRVRIKSEFQAKFDNQEFTVEDFEWGNIEKIGYIWFEDNCIGIVLKRKGRDKILDAIKHFQTLYFVEKIELIGELRFF